MAEDWRPITEEERNLAPAAEYPDAVIIFDRGFVKTEASGMDFRRYMRIKVFTDKGVSLVKQPSIDYFYYDQLFDLEARIIRDTAVIPVPVKKSTRVEQKGARRISHLIISDLKPGDILEYRYAIDYYGGFDKLGPEALFLFDCEHFYERYRLKREIQGELDERGQGICMRNIPTWFFDHPIFCKQSEFVAKIGANYDYLYVPVNVPPTQADPAVERIKVMTATAYKQHTWSLAEIRPYPTDASANLYRELDRCGLHFSRFASVGLGENRVIKGTYHDDYWRILGQTMQGYLNDYMKVTAAMRKRFDDVVRPGDTSMEAIARTVAYLKNNFTIDSTGYYLRPVHRNLEQLFNKKNGMPFEVNLLMLAMLRRVGFDARPVLISTTDRIPFRLSGSFNHLLVMVSGDGGNRYFDVTSPTGACDDLPAQCRVADGVCVNFDRSKKMDVCPDAK